MVTAGWKTVAVPTAGGSAQISTITVTRDSTFNSYFAGLIIYAPIQLEYTLGSTSWIASFTWAAPAAGSVVGSTFVIA
jgi:hypothetical protein